MAGPRVEMEIYLVQLGVQVVGVAEAVGVLLKQDLQAHLVKVMLVEMVVHQDKTTPVLVAEVLVL